MPAKLSVLLGPETETPGKTRIRQALFGRLRYIRELPNDEDASGAPATVKIDGSRRAELAIDGTATIEVADNLPKAPFSLQIETTQGTVLWQSPEQASGEGDTLHQFAVPDSVFDTQLNPPRAAPQPGSPWSFRQARRSPAQLWQQQAFHCPYTSRVRQRKGQSSDRGGATRPRPRWRGGGLLVRS